MLLLPNAAASGRLQRRVKEKDTHAGAHPIHPMLLATDLAAARAFYHDQLGLEVLNESEAAMRFDRRRYDAAQTIQWFSARLRQQIDLDTLTAELLGVVEQTMQPTSASLWLRPSNSASPGSGHDGRITCGPVADASFPGRSHGWVEQHPGGLGRDPAAGVLLRSAAGSTESPHGRASRTLSIR
jgi:catechol 2,3-dioxygenase-like lactoylglutathione lyase family enzyme